MLFKPALKKPLDVVKNSFYYRTINDWNSLTKTEVSKPSVDTFRTSLLKKF